MKASELIELLSEHLDYEVKVPCGEDDLVETTAYFPVEICEHIKVIYLG